MKGAVIILECLLEQGVDTVFGYPGGANLAIYDELFGYAGKIRHILTAHEQGAAHAADGYARVSGKTGVCLATSGPGATNLITGMAAAFMDSSPVVFITCNVNRELIGRDSFQEVDITGIAMPITKANFLVQDIESLAPIIREAFIIAGSGRKGPVLVDIPKDLTYAETEFIPAAPEALHAHLPGTPDYEDILSVCRVISESSRPLILAGGGIIRSDASEGLIRFAETLNAPVCCTMMALGAIPASHPLYLGLAGMHGGKPANTAINNCDLLIAIGTRFSDRVAIPKKPFAKNAKIIHIDIDRAEIGKNITADYHITGDARTVLDALNEALTPRQNEAWIAACFSVSGNLKRKKSKFSPLFITEEIYKVTNGGAIITTDVGKHQVWCAQYYPFDRGGQFITSGGFGSMGFGTGASIGAKLANPGAKIILITGDGSFMMNCTELATIVRYNLAVIIIVMNNRCLGMLRQMQDITGRYSETDISSPDFVKLAAAYGIDGCRAETETEFKTAFSKAAESGTAFLIDCVIDRDEPVYPIK